MASEVVIARYKEDLDWVGQIPPAFSVTIYNKGPRIESAGAVLRADKIVTLPNGGRESDTFLRHILGLTGHGEDFTVFLQGDPFEHSPDILRLLERPEQWRDLQPLSWRWRPSEDIPPGDILARETEWFIADGRVRPELFSLLTWSPVQFLDAGTERILNDYKRLHGLPGGINLAGHFLRRCEWPALAEQAERHLVGCFSYGALFAVRQTRLAALPRRSLELALEAANAHQMYGYILERLWLHMMGEPFRLSALASARFDEDMAGLPSRFVPQPLPHPRPRLHRRVVPAIKRRVVNWAQS